MKHGSVYYVGHWPFLRKRVVADTQRNKSENDVIEKETKGDFRERVIDALLDIRQRFGQEQMSVFLMMCYLRIRPHEVIQIMGYDPKSAMARSLSAMGKLGDVE